jgi:hypothetical protein
VVQVVAESPAVEATGVAGAAEAHQVIRGPVGIGQLLPVIRQGATEGTRLPESN